MADEAKTSAEEVRVKAEKKADEVKDTVEEYRARGENAVKGAVEGAKKGFNKK